MTRRRYGLPRPFQARIAGIPCLIQATHVTIQTGDARADNPDDFYGYEVVEFDVLDRNGRQADWLARKMSPDEEIAIREEILERACEYDCA